MSPVDPPDRMKWSDTILDWIADYRRRWEKRLARVDADLASTEWLCSYIAAQACTLEHAPIADRRAVIREIEAVMTQSGLWQKSEGGNPSGIAPVR
jgi:hypothetical protein